MRVVEVEAGQELVPADLAVVVLVQGVEHMPQLAQLYKKEREKNKIVETTVGRFPFFSSYGWFGETTTLGEKVRREFNPGACCYRTNFVSLAAQPSWRWRICSSPLPASLHPGKLCIQTPRYVDRDPGGGSYKSSPLPSP